MDHQVLLLLQAGVTAQEGVRIDLPWLLTGLATILTSLVTAVGVTYRGQIKALEDENRFLRGLVSQQAGTSETSTEVQRRAILLAEMRARGELK